MNGKDRAETQTTTTTGRLVIAACQAVRIIRLTMSKWAFGRRTGKFPGRCPGLFCSAPFGAKYSTAHRQNWRFGLVSALVHRKNQKRNSKKGTRVFSNRRASGEKGDASLFQSPRVRRALLRLLLHDPLHRRRRLSTKSFLYSPDIEVARPDE
jgi:hypothetical protein